MNLNDIISQCLTASALSQASIAIFGVTAVALSQSVSASARRWASVFGLVGQPFWFYSAATSQQWGIFVLCILYSIVWAKGFYSSWVNPPRWTTEEMVANAVEKIANDGRWMASDKVAAALTERYLQLLTPGWEKRSIEHSGQLRTRLGIDPRVDAPRNTAEKPFASQA